MLPRPTATWTRQNEDRPHPVMAQPKLSTGVMQAQPFPPECGHSV